MKRYTIRVGDVSTATVQDVSRRYSNWLVYVTYYVDNTFAVEATPSVGTVSVVGKSNIDEVTASFLNSPIDSTLPTTFASIGSNLKEITITPSGITGAGAMEIVIVGQD